MRGSLCRQGCSAQEAGGVDQTDRHRDELPPPAQDHTQGPQESKVRPLLTLNKMEPSMTKVRAYGFTYKVAAIVQRKSTCHSN